MDNQAVNGWMVNGVYPILTSFPQYRDNSEDGIDTNEPPIK